MLCQKLNDASQNLFKKTGFGRDEKNIKFYEGHIESTLKDLLLSISPNGKVAFVATEKSAVNLNKTLSKIALLAGVTLLTYTFDDYKTSTENASGLFSLPDDVRSVIVCDKEVVDLASYYASLKNLPLFIIPLTADANGLLRNKIYISTSSKIDAVMVKTAKHVIIDRSLISADYSGAYAFIMSKFIPLIDYRINLSVTGGLPLKTVFDSIKNSVLSTFGAPKLKNGLGDVMVYNSFITELAISSTNGEFGDFSAENVAVNLANQPYNSGLALYFATEIIKIYASICSTNIDFSALTDVNAISERLKETTNLDEFYFSDALIYQIKRLTKSGEKVKSQLKSLEKEIKSFSSLSNSIFNTYLLLGGKAPEKNDYSFAIINAGNTSKHINGMSLVREAGFIK